MNIRAPVSAQPPEKFPDWRYEHLEIDYDAPTRSVWMNYKADAPACFTPRTLAEMTNVRESLRALFASDRIAETPIRYFVIASRKPAIYGLGGDLATFSAAIGRRDLAGLLDYARACIDLIDSLLRDLDLPIVTISAVHGQCLGGAFEAALASDFILAEETAKFGVPEVSFNTFPGMGAVSLLTRRLGSALAEKIIAEGRAFSGREMFEIDAIDAVAPEGRLREQALDFMARGGEAHWLRRRSIAEARRKCFPVSRDELMRITELWAECSLRIDDMDLRHMERLVLAQSRLRRAPRANSTPAAEA